MPSELDLLTFSRQVTEVGRENAHRWSITQAPQTLRAYVVMTPVGSADVYCIRVDFGESLAAGPPSVAFCDPETHVEGRLRDWPNGLTQFFKTPPNNGESGWICNPWTREGRQHHAEWRPRGWSTKRALFNAISAMQDILDAPGAYTGRAA
jgi:hypothetical protein